MGKFADRGWGISAIAVTEHVPNKLVWWLGMRMMEPASFIMTRRFLLGVKERAEALRASVP